MTVLRITDYAGTSITITTNESSDDFNARIDEAFNTRNYSIRLVGFTRMDVRNIAMITELPSPAQPDQPSEPEQPVEPEEEDEPISDDPVEEEPEPPTEEPTENPEPEPSEDN